MGATGIEAVIRSLSRLEEVKRTADILREHRGTVAVGRCADAVKIPVICAMRGTNNDKGLLRLLVTYSERRAREMADEIRACGGEALYYPARDVLFYRFDIRGNELAAERMRVFAALSGDGDLTVVTTFDGLMDRVSAPERMLDERIRLKRGEKADLGELRRTLVRMGYEHSFQAEEAGQFAVRGGIADICPLTGDAAYRLEWWGDEIASVREFYPQSQRSGESVEEADIWPAAEKAADERGESFCEYFRKSAVLSGREGQIYIDEPKHCLERGAVVEQEFLQGMELRGKEGCAQPEQREELIAPKEAMRLSLKGGGVMLSAEDGSGNGVPADLNLRMDVCAVSPWKNRFDLLLADLRRYRERGYGVILVCASAVRAERLAGEFALEGMGAFFSDDPEREVSPGEIMIVQGRMRAGFECPGIYLAVLSETDIFGSRRDRRREKRYVGGSPVSDFSQIKPGDYVVHAHHGMGIYRGIEQVEIEHVTKDFIKIDYDRGDVLYVPTAQLEMISLYSGAKGRKVKINRLGGSEWSRTCSRVKKSVREVAGELAELYAIRQNSKGYAFSSDTMWQREFEEMFPYEETEDQIRAIRDTKKDMESTRIMDRLICGDVGFGKTEVAIRAAFKAVQDGRQVACLVPTTILAEQHYETFSSRMKDFPVNIEMLCRFKSAAEQLKTVERLKEGRTDVVIGTHRILSKDVVFKNLGLLIVDEEQRFGVAHKEKIKRLKKDVDVLTLSATPIPRTLHMSLSGIRDMSLLGEAPRDRMPIQTYVMEYNEELVREAIEREINREGQIFYVYNRVRQIEERTAQIAALVPDARVAYAHGQMPERELEDIMMSFVGGRIDVLVSTTIIETGLDIANVNTMIVHDADRMGLAQLYQLRGRIGRSHRTAYAFFMYSPDKVLREEARERLLAIREFSKLGSGYKIALRDLEIRGAGTVLGEAQSGHMEAVGYDLYCRMLKSAAREVMGETAEEDFETTVDLEEDAYIPDGYIEEEKQKLDTYRRIAGITNRAEGDEMREELSERFGRPPAPVRNLLLIAKIKADAHRLFVTEIKEKRREIRFVMLPNANICVEGVPKLIERYGGKLILSKDKERPGFVWLKGDGESGGIGIASGVIDSALELLDGGAAAGERERA